MEIGIAPIIPNPDENESISLFDPYQDITDNTNEEESTEKFFSLFVSDDINIGENFWEKEEINDLFGSIDKRNEYATKEEVRKRNNEFIEDVYQSIISFAEDKNLCISKMPYYHIKMPSLNTNFEKCGKVIFDNNFCIKYKPLFLYSISQTVLIVSLHRYEEECFHKDIDINDHERYYVKDELLDIIKKADYIFMDRKKMKKIEKDKKTYKFDPKSTRGLKGEEFYYGYRSPYKSLYRYSSGYSPGYNTGYNNIYKYASDYSSKNMISYCDSYDDESEYGYRSENFSLRKLWKNTGYYSGTNM